jgi:hypothetical protein
MSLLSALTCSELYENLTLYLKFDQNGNLMLADPSLLLYIRLITPKSNIYFIILVPLVISRHAEISYAVQANFKPKDYASNFFNNRANFQ